MLTSVSYSKVSALILHPSYTERNNLCAAPSESKSWHYFFKVWLAFLRLTFSKLPFVWQVKGDMITRNFLLLLVLIWFKFVLSMKETLVQVWASVVLYVITHLGFPEWTKTWTKGGVKVLSVLVLYFHM